MSLLYFLLPFFIKRENWNTFCMVTLLDDATSLYNKYLLSVFYNLAHFLYPLPVSESCAVPSVPCACLCVLFFPLRRELSFFFFLYQRVFVGFAPGLHCGSFFSFDLKGFLCFLFSFLISFVFNVNLWHDFEIKRLRKKIGPLRCWSFLLLKVFFLN